MNSKNGSQITRRDVIKIGMWGSLAALATPAFSAESQRGLAPIVKAIPATGEKIPVIGLGTNAYGVTDAAEIAARREVLQHMAKLGGKVIDTAQAYGRSEEMIGELLSGLGNRNNYFLATKTPIMGSVGGGAAVLEESFKRLRTDRIDLMQVHNMNGLEELLPVYREFKQAKKIRYIGITTSQDAQYEQMLAAMKKHQLDFIQVDYSLGNRGAEEQILPLAQERGIAVLANLPLGGRRGSLMAQVGDRKLPDWAKEIDVETWPQLFLKYVVSHPAVTAAIPGTTKLKHLEDNQRAGKGRLPDAAMRKRIEQLWS